MKKQQHRILDTERRLISENDRYFWYVQFNSKVFRIPKSKLLSETEYHINHLPKLVKGRARVNINKVEYDLMDLVLVSFSKYYRDKHIKTEPKDGEPLNCHGDNIRVLRTDLTDGLIRVQPKNLVGSYL